MDLLMYSFFYSLYDNKFIECFDVKCAFCNTFKVVVKCAWFPLLISRVKESKSQQKTLRRDSLFLQASDTKGLANKPYDKNGSWSKLCQQLNIPNTLNNRKRLKNAHFQLLKVCQLFNFNKYI